MSKRKPIPLPPFQIHIHTSRLAQLLLAEEHEEAHRNGQLKQERDPKPGLPQARPGIGREIREHVPGPDGIGRGGAGQDRGHGAQHLARQQGEEDMEARHRLQQDHAEADALQRVEHAEPEPEGPARERGRDGPARPGHVGADVGGRPEELGPAGRAQAHGEDGQDPRVRGREPGEDVEEQRPDEDEEEDDEEGDGPGGSVRGRPEVEPVAAVGSREPVILDDDDDAEPLVGMCVSCGIQ